MNRVQFSLLPSTFCCTPFLFIVSDCNMLPHNFTVSEPLLCNVCYCHGVSLYLRPLAPPLLCNVHYCQLTRLFTTGPGCSSVMEYGALCESTGPFDITVTSRGTATIVEWVSPHKFVSLTCVSHCHNNNSVIDSPPGLFQCPKDIK